MEPQNPLPDQAMAKGRLQDKADILESNLFNAVSQQKDKINIHFKISREQFPDAVILKALSQLFPRINIKGNTILLMKPSPPQADGVLGLNTAPQGAGY